MDTKARLGQADGRATTAGTGRRKGKPRNDAYRFCPMTMAAECKRIESAQHEFEARERERAEHLRQAQVLEEERAGRIVQAQKCSAGEAAGGAERRQPAATVTSLGQSCAVSESNSDPFSVVVRVPVAHNLQSSLGRLVPVTADGTDTLDVLKAKVGKAIRLHPDTFILKHRGIVLSWIQHVRAYELPDCPLLEAEVAYAVDIPVRQPERERYDMIRNNSWGRSRVLTGTRAHTPVRSHSKLSARRNCATCGLVRAPDLDMPAHHEMNGKTPCIRGLTFRAKSKINPACVHCGKVDLEHYRDGGRLLCFDTQRFTAANRRRVFNVDMTHQPLPAVGSCQQCGRQEDLPLSPSRYCFQDRHWLCCICRGLDFLQSCKSCQSRVQAFRTLETKLHAAFRADRFDLAMEAVAEARCGAGQPFLQLLGEIWKLAVAFPSGIEYLMSNEGGQYITNGVLNASYPRGFATPGNASHRIIRDYMHMVTDDIVKLVHVTRLDISNNPYLRRLPDTLSQMQSLQQLCCCNCPQLMLPPPQMCDEAGEAALRFVRDAKMNSMMRNSIDNRCVLFTIGEFQSGKTSIVNALTSLDETVHIAERRWDVSPCRPSPTMGFEQRLWLPAGESSKFVVFDLGGHPLNRHLHQRLLAKRAIYVLTWRARSARNIGKLDTSVVLDFLNDLRLIVPGAAVVLVVTHCDCVMRSELEAQCLSVQTAVEGFLGSFPESVLDVRFDANSIAVNGRSGDGISELSVALLNTVKQCGWYRQQLSSSWSWLAEEIEERAKNVLCLEWEEFVQLATACGITKDEFKSLIIFLHETARVRFCGLEMLDIATDIHGQEMYVTESGEHRLPNKQEQWSVPLGLKWEFKGAARPSEGTELSNVKLAEALQSTTEFTREEWAKFGIIEQECAFVENGLELESLTLDHFIESNSCFFKPAPVDIQTECEWEREKLQMETELALLSMREACQELKLREESHRNTLEQTLPLPGNEVDSLISEDRQTDIQFSMENSGASSRTKPMWSDMFALNDNGGSASKDQNYQDETDNPEQGQMSTAFQQRLDHGQSMRTLERSGRESDKEKSSQEMDSPKCRVYLGFQKMSKLFFGILRQDRGSLLKYFAENQDQEGLEDICMLHSHGVLRRRLLRFLWPNKLCSYWQNAWEHIISACSSDFPQEFEPWGWLEMSQKYDAHFHDVVSGAEDERKVLLLLQDFNLLVPHGSGEYLVWDLTAPHLQNVIDQRTMNSNEFHRISITVPRLPHAFLPGLAIRMSQQFSAYSVHGDIGKSAAQIFKDGQIVQVFVSGTSSGFSRLTICASHANGMTKAVEAMRHHLQLFPGLESPEWHTMQQSELTKRHGPVSVLLATNVLFGAFEARRDHRSRESIRSVLISAGDRLAQELKKSTEKFMAESEAHLNSAASEAKSHRLHFKKVGGNPKGVCVDNDRRTLEFKEFSTVVGNECFRTGQLGYYELEILEMGSFNMSFGVVTSEFEGSARPLNSGIGDDDHSWCIRSSCERLDSEKGHNGNYISFGSSWKTGDVIGLACDLQVGLLRISINGKFMTGGGVAHPLPLSPSGLYPAITAKSGRVMYNFGHPFLYPAPAASFDVLSAHPERNIPIYMSLLECCNQHSSSTNIGVYSDRIQRVHRRIKRQQFAIDVLSKIVHACPQQHSMEMTFPDSVFSDLARVVVVIVDEDVLNTQENYDENIREFMGDVTGWDRQRYHQTFQSYRGRLVTVRDMLSKMRGSSTPESIVIPVLIPGWDAHLQPEESKNTHALVAEMKNNPFAIELRPDHDWWSEAIENVFITNLNRCLAGWRGNTVEVARIVRCPTCLKLGDEDSLPFCFDYGSSIRNARSSRGQVQCPTCVDNGREPSKIQVVQAPVYISHCADEHEASNKLLTAICSTIESKFNYYCFRTHQTTAAGDRYNLDLFKHVSSIVICLSDRYLRSESSLAELRFVHCGVIQPLSSSTTLLQLRASIN